MRISTFAAGFGLIALAACGKSDGNQAAAQRAGPGATAGAPAPNAGAPAGAGILSGEWEMVIETTGVTGAALPPEVLAAMKGKKVTTRTCITPEQARQQSARMFAGPQQGNCSRTGLDVTGGHIHGTVTCSGGASKMVMEMDGQYSPESFDYTVSMTNMGQGTGMKIDSHAIGRRVGECTPAKPGQ